MIKRYLFYLFKGLGIGLGAGLITFLLSSCEVNALSNSITIPQWGNYVFGVNGSPHFGYNSIEQLEISDIDYFRTPVFNIPTGNTVFYINTFWGTYDTSPLDIEFLFFTTVSTSKNLYGNFTANSTVCSSSATTEKTYLVKCNGVVPTKEGNNSRIEIRTSFLNSSGVTAGTMRFGISKNNNYFINKDYLDQENNKNVSDIKDSIIDSNVDDASTSGSSFFDSFKDNDVGGISGIVSAPLRTIQSMSSDTCTDLSVEWEGNTISIPSGCSFWDSLGAIKEILQVLECGFIAYYIALDLYKIINNLKNPDDSKVEVMDL